MSILRDTSNVESVLIGLAYKIYHCVEDELQNKLTPDRAVRKQLRILKAIFELDCATPTLVARETRLAPADLTKYLDLLELRNKIRRVYDLKDRRSYRLEILQNGIDDVVKSDTIMSVLPEQLIASLSEDEKGALGEFLQNFPKNS